MKHLSPLLVLLCFFVLPSRGMAQGSIPAVLSSCETLATVAAEKACGDSIADFIGTDRAAARQAERVIRQLSWAANSNRVDADAIFIGLELVQRSDLPKVAKQRAFAVASKISPLDDQINPSFGAIPPELTEALGAEMDGFELLTPEGETYTIVSTFASSEKLCRVVSLETRLTFAIESFCKVKGGEWR